jgi:hypothetical protein
MNVLIVLLSDIYQSVVERNPELKGELERYTLHVDLRAPQFLEEVVKAHSGRSRSSMRATAREVFERARLAAH